MAAPGSIDFDREVALVVTTRRGDEETIIGVGRYVRGEAADTGRSAELAFIVEEDYQGLDIASRLLTHLVQTGRQKNISRFVADAGQNTSKRCTQARAGRRPVITRHRPGRR